MPTTMTPNRRVFVAGKPPAASALNIAVPPRPAVHPPECCCPACVGLKCLERTRYFSGQLLTEADLNNEQFYWLAKSRLHNRYLHGWGVVCGMQVVCGECDGWVTVKPGYAIDPCGNDIIVCADQPFNVIKAINACCTPSKQISNCAPLRATPPDTCKDALQKWCITIEYREQESRMVAPLKQATPKSGRCSCGGIKGTCGCGCGCGCGGSNGSSHGASGKCTCSSTQTQTATAVPAGACEPTRINEGFRLCVIPWTQTEVTKGSLPGTVMYQIEQCAQAIQRLTLQVPQLDKGPGTITDPQLAFAAVCNFLATVKQQFTAMAMTRCDFFAKLTQLGVPPPPPNATISYIDNQLRPFLDDLGQLVLPALIDCICMAFIPPCPPDPCDDRLCLACVTVQSGKIIDICLFGCRHQLVTFHTLYYWLSVVGLDRVLAALKRGFDLVCCGEREIKGGLFGANIPPRANFTTAGITTPAMVNQMMAMFLAQKLGASIINAVAPGAQAVDLRPLVGLDMRTVNQTLLESFKIDPQNITAVPVDSDPAWAHVPVTEGAQFAPAAFSIKDNLTVFTRGEMVVGFDVTDPVAVLTKQVQKLQQQVNQLSGPGRGITPESGRGPAKKK